jgi:double-stranded uracil-DNA glycosylase
MKTLPDYLPKESKLVIVGCNPSLTAARTGFYYSGRGNQFWSLLYESGLVPERLKPIDTGRVTQFGIGLTDLVKRPSKGSDGVSMREFAEGRDVLDRKLRGIGCPKVIVFNGKIVYERFIRRGCNYGLQEERLYGAKVYVLPSTSRRCARTSYAQKLRHFRRVRQLLQADERYSLDQQSSTSALLVHSGRTRAEAVTLCRTSAN